MRKVFFVLICFTAVAAVHAAGIGEFRGRNYLIGEWAAGFAMMFANGEDVRDVGVAPAISNNRLYFIIPIYQHDLSSGIMQRGYLQNGDMLARWDEDGISFDVIYKGQRRTIRELFPNSNSMRYALVYAEHGRTISVFDIVTDVEMERDLRILEWIQ